MSTVALTKKKLLLCLIDDGIYLNEEKLAKVNKDDSCSLSQIGDIYYKRNNHKKAIDWYRLAAAEENADAQYKIGLMYQYGEGVPVNFKYAMDWYKKAHKNGNLIATNSIGFLYSQGEGVEKDHKVALEWYREAANKGYDIAQFNVAFNYEKGYGTESNKEYALEWYKKSADQGFEAAKEAIKILNNEQLFG